MKHYQQPPVKSFEDFTHEDLILRLRVQVLADKDYKMPDYALAFLSLIPEASLEVMEVAVDGNKFLYNQHWLFPKLDKGIEMVMKTIFKMKTLNGEPWFDPQNPPVNPFIDVAKQFAEETIKEWEDESIPKEIRKKQLADRLIKLRINDFVPDEYRILILKLLVHNDNIRAGVLTTPEWIDLSQKYKAYIL